MIPGSAFEDSFPYARPDDRKDNTRTSKRKGGQKPNRSKKGESN